MGFGHLVRIGAALATAGAGILHLDAAGDHTDHPHIVAFFVAVAVGQLAWAASVARRECTARTLGAGLALNAGVLVVWGISRTVGLPDIIPDAGGVEEIGWKDAAAGGLELAALAAAGIALVMPPAATSAVLASRTAERVVRSMVAGALAITVPGVLVSHDHEHGLVEHAHDAHDDDDAHAAAHEDAGHGHGDGELAALADHDHQAAAGAGSGHDHLGAGGAASHVHAEVVEGHGHGDHQHDQSVAAPHDHAVGPATPGPLDGPGTISTLRLGPIPLLPMVPGVDLPHLSPAVPFVGPGRMNLLPLAGLPPPCTDCWVLGVQPDLVYADGSSANIDTGPMLHHAVFTDMSREDPVCGRDTAVGWLGHRVFAAGNERTGLGLPEGFGYPISDGLWGGVVELMNMSTELRTVFIEATVRWVPRSTPGIEPVTPVWMDIDSCGDSEFDVPAGVTDTVWDWQSNLTGRIVAAGGHLHDGGTWLGLANASTGENVCISVAGYGTKPEYVGTIESMSGCAWDRLASLRAGDVLRLTAHYNTSAPADAVMGIMMIFVYETDDLAAGTASPYPDHPPPDGAPADTGHQH